MALPNPIARKLHVRIWLAVAGSVAVLSLLVGWAWHVADRERDRERERQPTAREVMVRNAAGELIGSAEAMPRRGAGLEFVVTLADGQVLQLQLPPRGRGPGAGGGPRRPDGPMAWLRPPFGFVWVLALAGLAVMVGVFPVARRLTVRLEALQRGVQRWGEGDLSVRLPETGQDEVADLSRRFNSAAERVQSLMATQAGLLQSQKSLLANASHELRSPLARIRMALELMGPNGSAGAAPAAGAPAARAEVARSINELDQLIDEILLASRLDAQTADLGSVEEVDLIGLVAEECAHVGARFEPVPGLDSALVLGVAKLIRRAVRNLLENARRHGGTDISAELALENGQAVLHVNDRGPGVPAALRERIFEPFYRLPGASERDGGAGLGLSLVRAIALRHGGSVACTDRDGGGARFRLSLPLATEPR